MGPADPHEVRSPQAADPARTKQSESARLFNRLLTECRELLPKEGSSLMSEEQLFAVILSERLQSAQGSKLRERFHDLMESYRSDQGDRFSWEEAGKQSLDQITSERLLSAKSSRKIYSQAFAAAQFDDNNAVLFDARGSRGDHSVAVARRREALEFGATALKELKA